MINETTRTMIKNYFNGHNIVVTDTEATEIAVLYEREKGKKAENEDALQIAIGKYIDLMHTRKH